MVRDRAAQKDAFVEKAVLELGELAEQGVRFAGNAFSSVTLVKGTPEPEGAEPFSGEDGGALRNSLIALGYAPEDWNGFLSCTDDGTPLPLELFLKTVVALDPATLIICDEPAAELARNAFASDLVELADFEAAMLAPGTLACVRGVRMLNLGGFADALGDNHAKQVMWSRLKKLPPLGEPY